MNASSASQGPASRRPEDPLGLDSLAEQEQERLGRELHDGLGQELAGAAFLAKVLADRLATGDPNSAADAEWIKTILGRCLENVRSLSRRLSPTELERGHLLAALERLCADVERSYGIRCEFDAGDGACLTCNALGPDAARQLFRVCQEAVTNATRHGRCGTVHVRLLRRGRRIRLSISDDGVGFSGPRPAADTPGIGLRSMAARATRLGGQLRIGRRAGWTHVMLVALLPCASQAGKPSPFPPGVVQA